MNADIEIPKLKDICLLGIEAERKKTDGFGGVLYLGNKTRSGAIRCTTMTHDNIVSTGTKPCRVFKKIRPRPYDGGDFSATERKLPDVGHLKPP
jgi:hypothetical protein